MAIVDNEKVLETVQKCKAQFYADYITPELTPDDARLMKSFIDMGAEMSQKILLQYTVPLYQKAERNTVILKKAMKIGAGVVSLILTTLGLAVLNLVLNP